MNKLFMVSLLLFVFVGKVNSLSNDLEIVGSQK